MQNDTSELSFCPSFNCYSDDKKLVDIAAKVTRDFKSDDVLDDEEFEFFNLWENTDQTSSFPIFNRDLLLNGEEEKGGDDDDAEEAIRIPLRDLFIGDGDLPSSSSSSEADELEGVPTGTYCVWTPKQSAESSPNRCKKSRSTGSCSKRWRLKDLLKRSNSDGKVSSSSSSLSLPSFLNFEKNSTGKKHEEKLSEKTATTKKKAQGEVQAKKTKRVEKLSAHEAFYVRNKASKEGDKRRSYLPYRQDLVGIFANVHGLGRTFPPF
ncbi:hypothetical protein QUC31_018187 [Theobroma cacao]|uniref:Uncharacterized protein LOC18600765 n=2 Tax=Theobroma cacao TaxID=3641 RepID=A0AB32W5G5_THECC|nr:PREDICTED: uncharacterized protein LOC18600765 [Theobroma cacao]EOY02405.1 Uncharacterized protein TCM_016889 [Theobroma cacao]WRX19790.1 Protein of unknown function DUF1645 [Theobroma cacao]